MMELLLLAHDPLNLVVLRKRLEMELVAGTSRDNVVSTLSWCIACKKKHGLKLAKLSSACVKIIVPIFDALRRQLKEGLPDEYYSGIKQTARS